MDVKHQLKLNTSASAACEGGLDGGLLPFCPSARGLKCCEFLNSKKREKRTCRGWIRLLYTGMSRMAAGEIRACEGTWSALPHTEHCQEGLNSPLPTITWGSRHQRLQTSVVQEPTSH